MFGEPNSRVLRCAGGQASGGAGGGKSHSLSRRRQHSRQNRQGERGGWTGKKRGDDRLNDPEAEQIPARPKRKGPCLLVPGRQLEKRENQKNGGEVKKGKRHPRERA